MNVKVMSSSRFPHIQRLRNGDVCFWKLAKLPPEAVVAFGTALKCCLKKSLGKPYTARESRSMCVSWHKFDIGEASYYRGRSLSL